MHDAGKLVPEGIGSPFVLSQYLEDDLVNVFAVPDSIHHHPCVEIIDPINNPEPFQLQGSEQGQFVLQRLALIWIFIKPFESGFDIFSDFRVQAGEHVSCRSRQFDLKCHYRSSRSVSGLSERMSSRER